MQKIRFNIQPQTFHYRPQLFARPKLSSAKLLHKRKLTPKKYPHNGFWGQYILGAHSTYSWAVLAIRSAYLVVPFSTRSSLINLSLVAVQAGEKWGKDMDTTTLLVNHQSLVESFLFHFCFHPRHRASSAATRPEMCKHNISTYFYERVSTRFVHSLQFWLVRGCVVYTSSPSESKPYSRPTVSR